MWYYCSPSCRGPALRVLLLLKSAGKSSASHVVQSVQSERYRFNLERRQGWAASFALRLRTGTGSDSKSDTESDADADPRTLPGQEREKVVLEQKTNTAVQETDPGARNTPLRSKSSPRRSPYVPLSLSFLLSFRGSSPSSLSFFLLPSYVIPQKPLASQTYATNLSLKPLSSLPALLHTSSSPFSPGPLLIPY